MSIKNIFSKAHVFHKLLLIGALSLLSLNISGCTNAFSSGADKSRNVSKIKLTRVLNHKHVFYGSSLASIVSRQNGFGNTLTNHTGSSDLVTFQNKKVGFGRHSKDLHNFAFSGATDKHHWDNPSDHSLLLEPPIYYHINNKKHELVLDQRLGSVGNLDKITYKLTSASKNFNGIRYNFIPVKISRLSGHNHLSRSEKADYSMHLITDGSIHK